MYMHSNIPRSSSTSDLFDASIPPAINSRRRKVGSGLKNNFSSSDVWSIPASTPTEATSSSSAASLKSTSTTRSVRRYQLPPPRPLTPYQLQRKQMKSSFQFPNGENFTPRNRCMVRSSSSVQLATQTVQRQPAVQLPPSRAQTLKGFRVGGDFTMDDMPRSQSLTSLSPLPRNTLFHNSPIGLHSSANPLENSNSTETVLSSNGSNESTRDSIRDSTRGSSSSVQSKPTTVSTSDKEVYPPSKPFLPVGEQAGSPSGSLDSTNDEEFQSARASLITEEPTTDSEEDQESLRLEPGSPLQVGLEPEEITEDQLDEESGIRQDDMSVQAPEPGPEPGPESQREPLREPELDEVNAEGHIFGQGVQELPSMPGKNSNTSKKSKFGKFFRKIFRNTASNGLRKRKRIQTPNSSSSSSPVVVPPSKTRHRNVSVTEGGSPISNTRGSSVKEVRSNAAEQEQQTMQQNPTQEIHSSGINSGTNSNNKIDKPRQSSLTPSLEVDEDVLMDTDLVFDSLLLKADSNHPSACNRQRDLQLKLQTLASPEASPTDRKECGSLGWNSVSNPGSLIKDGTDDNDSNVDYELIQEFSKLGNYIEGSSNELEPIENPKNLEDQAKIHIPRTNSPPQRSSRRPSLPNKDLAQSFYGSCDGDTRMIKRLQESWDNVHFDSAPPVMTNEGSREKSLRFAHDIYIKDTWSPIEYFRSDKRFIRERRRMMQLENSGFVNSIKKELNEYKRNEMAVHIDSAKFTHFFV